MSLLRRIFSNSFWLLLGSSIGRLAMFLTNIFAARFLGRDLFGQYTMVRSTISLASNFITGALGLTATKHVAEGEYKDPQNFLIKILAVFSINFIFNFIFSLILILFSDQIINSFFLGELTLKNALFVGALLLFTSTNAYLAQSILVGLERFKIIAIINLVVSILFFPIILILIKYGKVIGTLSGVTLYFLFDLIFKVYFLKTKILSQFYTINKESFLAHLKKLSSFSLPLVLSLFFSSGSFWYSKVFILNRSNRFAEIAIFDAAYQWLTIIMLITGATTSVALPMLSKAVGQKNKFELTKIFNINLIINIIISATIALIIIIFSPYIMRLYGESFVEGSDILSILAITSIFFSISSILNKYMISHNKVWHVLFSSFIGMLTLFYVLFLMQAKLAFGLSIAFLSYYLMTTLTYTTLIVIKK
ncbi:polysaccharide biosynthesis protein [Caldithrix abyssi DSM 13497]|uniref:Polysaccharide biosynthesis protein n=2 Tax=Caldithrix abyssi DSM 13497 TaxID=880073 RepID=H1XWL0_CALAY|nr:oligosaccharide flippase family protein [Caldithrix abyssi]EHO41848.1 polysaccharide biosynthesis protein [Caldithrix abyssi DSM 13497]